MGNVNRSEKVVVIKIFAAVDKPSDFVGIMTEFHFPAPGYRLQADGIQRDSNRIVWPERYKRSAVLRANFLLGCGQLGLIGHRDFILLISLFGIC